MTNTTRTEAIRILMAVWTGDYIRASRTNTHYSRAFRDMLRLGLPPTMAITMIASERQKQFDGLGLFVPAVK